MVRQLLEEIRGTPSAEEVKKDADEILSRARESKDAAKRMKWGAGGLGAVLLPWHAVTDNALGKRKIVEPSESIAELLKDEHVVFKNAAWKPYDGTKADVNFYGVALPNSRESISKMLSILRRHGHRLSERGEGIRVYAAGNFVRINIIGPAEKREEYEDLKRWWQLKVDKGSEGTEKGFDPGKWFNDFNPFGGF